MAEEDRELCMHCVFPDLRDNKKNVFFVVDDQLSVTTSGRIIGRQRVKFERCKHLNQSIYLSQNDFLIPLT